MISKMPIIILFIFHVLNLFAQSKSDNWYFGDSVLLKFNEFTLEAIPAAGIAHEASASISDNSGNLLFYTNGVSVWNRLNAMMSNGDSLDIDQIVEYGSSITQGVIIVPFPENDNQYYIFTIADSNLKYSIVDMSLDGGLGDIIDNKNMPIIFDKLTQQMNAVLHGNGLDWWLIIHKKGIDEDSSNVFYKLLITTDTIFINTQHVGKLRSGNNVGEMTFTQAGNRLALADNNGLEIFSFDRCTAQLVSLFYLPISNIIDSDDYLYGCEFSQDGNKLYISTLSLNEFSKLYQYCFNCNDPFPETQKLIYDLVVDNYLFLPKYTLGQLQIGPDNKIYIATSHFLMPTDDFSEYTMNLSVINNPNIEGLACNLDTNNIYLGGRRTLYGLPNLPNYNLGALAGSECDTIIEVAIDNIEIQKVAVNIYPNPANNFIIIDSHITEYSGISLEIINMNGIKVKEIYITSPSQKINTDKLSSGLYNLIIKQQGNNIFNTKLTIAH